MMEFLQKGANQVKIQIKKKWHEYEQQQNNQNRNQGWGNQNNWGNNNNNNGWGQTNNNNNNGWGQINNNNNNGWGQSNNNNNGWGNNNNNNNGWGNQGGNQGGNSGGFGDLFGTGIQWAKHQWQQKHNFQMINNNGGNFMNDLKNVLEQQIVYLEPSPAEKKLEELKRQGKKFQDQRFPPNVKSLSGQWGQVSSWRTIKWQRITEVIKNPQIVVGKIQPNDIKQGYLGDCYFLAGLAALAERQQRIMNLFLVHNINEQKYFSVKMLYKGKWMTIDMDQYVPCMSGTPAFSKARDKQLWVILLEKAWAKMYTSYKRIQAGYPQQALHDLTGAPIKQISCQGQGFNKDEEFKYLEMASNKGYAMVTSSQAGSDTNKSVSGVVLGHAYTFLKAATISFQGRPQRIVKLRNPWGKSEPHGDWRDDDQKWNYVSSQDKARVGYGSKADDGVFFMSWNDFVRQFRAITIAQIDDNASYVYKSYKDPNNKGCYFRIQILKSGRYSLQMDKTPERSYPQKIQDRFRYPTAKLDIGQLQGNSCRKLQGVVSARRTLFKQYNLQPGKYIVKSSIDYDRSLEKDFDVNLAVYGQYVCKVQLATNQQAAAFQGRSVDWHGQQSKSNGVNQDIWNNLGNLDWGNNAKGVLSEWGNQGNSNWGNQNQGNNNNGWGNQGSNNDVWGNQGSNNNNNGWGNQNQGNKNDGWGNQNQGNSNWGNQNKGNINNGWGNQGSNNDGWGNQNQQNNGWGNKNQGNNNSWGTQNQNNNNGWGNENQSNSNNGWGNQNQGSSNQMGWNQQQNNNNNNGWGNQNQQNYKRNDGW